MFTCPNCGSETRKLIGCDEEKKVKCPNCHQLRSYTPCDLHEVIHQGEDGKGRVTRGKMFEIDNRVLAEDGKTVINRKTKQLAQY